MSGQGFDFLARSHYLAVPVRLGCVLPVSQPVMTGKIPSATNGLRGSLAGRGIAPTGITVFSTRDGLGKGRAPNGRASTAGSKGAYWPGASFQGTIGVDLGSEGNKSQVSRPRPE